MCVDGVYVFEGDVQMVSVKSRFKSGGLFSSLDDYSEALSVTRIFQVRDVYYLSRAFTLVKSLGLRRICRTALCLCRRIATEWRRCELGTCYFCFGT